MQFPVLYSKSLLLFIVQSCSCFLHVSCTLCDPMVTCQASLSLTISRSLPKLMSIASMLPSSRLILCCPLLLLTSIFSSIGEFSRNQLFTPDEQNTGVSASVSVLTSEYSELISLKIDWFNLLSVQGTLRSLLQHHSFKASILQVALHLLYGLALTTVHNYWEDHSLDCMYFCWQSNISAFQHTVEVCHSFSADKQMSSDFMAAVTVRSDFGAQEEEICHYFHLFPFYLP